MERLTEDNYDYCLSNCHHNTQCNFSVADGLTCPDTKRYTRLSEYEHLGFEPQVLGLFLNALFGDGELKLCDLADNKNSLKLQLARLQLADRTQMLESVQEDKKFLSRQSQDLRKEILRLREELTLVPEKYAEYQKLEQEDLLMKLPCKLGTEVFILYNTRGCENCVKAAHTCSGIDCPKPMVVKRTFQYRHLDCLCDIKLTMDEVNDTLKHISLLP